MTRPVSTALADTTCPMAVVPNSDMDQLTLSTTRTDTRTAIDLESNVRNAGGWAL
jgi:hypothetical protein